MAKVFDWDEWEEVVFSIVGGYFTQQKSVFDICSGNGTRLQVKGSKLAFVTDASITPGWKWNVKSNLFPDRYDQLILIGDYEPGSYQFFDVPCSQVLKWNRTMINCASGAETRRVRRRLENNCPREGQL